MTLTRPAVRACPPLTYTYSIYVEDDQAQAERYCWLTLYDSQARVTDSQLVLFYTNATVFDEVPRGGTNGTGDGEGQKKLTACADKCKNIYDVS